MLARRGPQRHATSIMRVAEIMSRRVRTLLQSQSLREAAQFLSRYDISGAPVLDENGIIVGYLSRTDIIEALAHHSEITGLRVESVMSHEIVSIAPDASIDEALNVMVYEGVHRLVVRIGEGEPQGIISSLDALRALTKQSEKLRLRRDVIWLSAFIRQGHRRDIHAWCANVLRPLRIVINHKCADLRFYTLIQTRCSQRRTPRCSGEADIQLWILYQNQALLRTSGICTEWIIGKHIDQLL